jgi:putative ABC transport system permease protein
MKQLFGIPTGTLLVVLAIGLGAALAVVALLAARHPVLLRLGARNVSRRGARTALIVVGLMLGTAIIAAALTTGDTMSHTIRADAIRSLGNTDEMVSARGAKVEVGSELGSATGTRYFDRGAVARVDRALAGSQLVDGVTPAIIEAAAVQDPARRRNEPRVTLFAADPARMRGFGAIVGTRGAVTLAGLRPGELYLNEHAARELHARVGDRVIVFTGRRPASMRVRDIVRYDGGGTSDSGALLPLGAAQQLLGHPGAVQHIVISNRGGAEAGARMTGAVVQRLQPALAPLGLEADETKRDAIDAADKAGSAFMAFFTTFGSFSISAGILLIFLIFVMLAAERRGELGIARAIGTRRSHVVEMFVFEGAAYDLVAALVGAALGAGVAYAIVAGMAQALGSAGFDVHYAASARSLLIAYSLGVLLTFVVVALSALRVSRMTVAAALRNLSEPPAEGRRRRLALPLATTASGALLALSGYAGAQATPLLLGISLVLVAAVPLLRAAGVADRLAYTGAGVAIVVLWMLPWSAWETIFGELHMDFSTWIVSGLMIVVGAVWTIMFNADVLLSAAAGTLGRWRRIAPMLRMAMAYPLAARFRTGITLAMFTLVVFTLVTGTTTSGSFNHAFEDVGAFGGGFDVRASTAAATPIDDMRRALTQTRGLRPADFRAVASQSLLPLDARQLGTSRKAEPYLMRGLDNSFLARTTFGLGAMAHGYRSARDVWSAVARRPGLAVVDSFVVPRRDNFGFTAMPAKFKVSGFFFDDATFDPIPLQVRDPQTGRRLRLTVIGVLKDTAPLEMAGISTSQRTAVAAFPGRTRPTIHYFKLAPGVAAGPMAGRLEAAFLRNGMQAESIGKVMRDATAGARTFNHIILGFMALGLIVGVAALGVISARAIVERRQQIGVLRAIGFRRGMVQTALLLESSFVALTAIVVGTSLGLLLAANIVRDSRRQPSWDNLTLVVPWTALAVIFVAVYAVALLATLAPALRASRIRPAESLRYE